MRGISDVIEDGGPHEGENIRRLALRATSRVSDPVRQAELYEALVTDLECFELEHICGGARPIMARDHARLTLAAIEAASVPN